MLRTIKLHAKGVLAKIGYEVRRVQRLESHVPWIVHSSIRPYATYSPWLADHEFRRTYDAIRYSMLVDQYRCYELWALVGEATKLADGDLIEVGVWRGGTGCLIARRWQLAGHTASSVHLCDNFEGIVKSGSCDPSFVGGELSDTSEAAVSRLVRKLDLTNVQVWKGIFPDETGSFLEDRTFRFCHIDVAVYQSAKDIFGWLWGRVVQGGIVVFDDYGFGDSEGITALVEEGRDSSDRLVIHNLNGHAIVIKLR